MDRTLLQRAKRRLTECMAFNRTGRAFRNIFSIDSPNNDDQLTVLKSLHTFFYVGVISHGSDPIKLARAVGRREVYNWIVSHTEYDEIELELMLKQIKESEDE